MSAKNISPRLFCILGLVAVAVISGLLFLTTSLEKTLIGTCVTLIFLVCYIIYKMSDGWINQYEAEQMRSDQSRSIACLYLHYLKRWCFSAKVTQLSGAIRLLKSI